MITLENVTCAYPGGKQVLETINLHIEEGETVGLIGANGAGKSTLMKALLGLAPYQGKITIDGQELKRDTLAEIRKTIGFVMQNSDNQMFMPTVYEDMLFGPMNYGATRKEAEEAVEEVLEMLGLAYLKPLYNHKISGGEKRMAAIATILAMRPKVVMMDEPTSALDPYNRRRVMETLKKISGTKILASHDLDFILDTCDRVLLLGEGKLVADGKAEEILSDGALLERYRLELPLSLTRR
ncbi:MAG: energy-coupling factor ABC transporter ATP-binding protein [Acetatifactor sp.]|nr:energy-coupling factor ABC transporter ATP-binding protein [Acetatifactor sp.]